MSLLNPITAGDEFSFRAGEDLGDSVYVGDAKILRAKLAPINPHYLKLARS